MSDKKIIFHSLVKKSQVKQPIASSWSVFTSDYNTVSVQFVVDDLKTKELIGVRPSMTLQMNDGSVIQKTANDIQVEDNVFTYILQNSEGNHIGSVDAQLKLTFPNGNVYTTNIHQFTILESLDDIVIPKEFVIGDLTRILIEVKHHIDTIFAREPERERVFKAFMESVILSEKQRQLLFEDAQRSRSSLFKVLLDAMEVVRDDYDELVDTGILESNISEKLTNLELSYAPRLSTLEQNDVSLTTQLQQTATKEEVAIKVSQIVSGSPKGTYLTLSALQTAYPTGNTGIYIVSEDGNWYYWNGNAWNAGGVYQSRGIEDNSITEEKTDMLSTNLFDRNTAPNGFYTLGLSFYDNGSTSFSSQKVAISKGDIIKLNFKTTGPHHLQFFDANEVIKKVTPYTAPSVDYSFYLKIDNDYKYFSVAFTKSSGGASNDTLKSVYKVKGTQALSLLTEKKIKEVVTAEFLSPFIPESGGGSPTIGVDSFYSNENYNAIGDSITLGYLGSANGGYMERPYPTVVKELVGFASARNYGISGTCIASGYGAKPTEGMVDRYSLMDNDAHVISVLGGVNDRDQNVPLGTFGSTDKTNFYGALKIIVEGLINKYPSKVIFLMTPLSRGLETTNTAGHKLSDYAKVVKEIGAYYGLPVLDLHASSNFFPYITANKDANSMDGLHPNQAYVENILARKIAGFIKTIA